MQHSSSSNASSEQLKIWLARPEVGVRSYLKAPSRRATMHDTKRKDDELKERTEAAKKIREKCYGHDIEFTAIMDSHQVAKNADSEKVHLSVIREVLRELQEEAREKYLSAQCAFNSKLQAA